MSAYVLRIKLHFLIRESDYLKTSFFEPLLSYSIIFNLSWLRMVATIYFNNELLLKANEVYYEVTNNILPLKFLSQSISPNH